MRYFFFSYAYISNRGNLGFGGIDISSSRLPPKLEVFKLISEASPDISKDRISIIGWQEMNEADYNDWGK